MTTLAQRLDDDDLDLVVECAVNRVFAELERSGSDRWPIDDMGLGFRFGCGRSRVACGGGHRSRRDARGTGCRQ